MKNCTPTTHSCTHFRDNVIQEKSEIRSLRAAFIVGLLIFIKYQSLLRLSDFLLRADNLSTHAPRKMSSKIVYKFPESRLPVC